MLQKSLADGQLALLAILSSLGWKGSILTEAWHLLLGQPADPLATIINSALDCATQVFFT